MERENKQSCHQVCKVTKKKRNSIEVYFFKKIAKGKIKFSNIDTELRLSLIFFFMVLVIRDLFTDATRSFRRPNLIEI